ncbi:TetR/AcrR family transcriptional regulator [Actinomadura verrucosospora]|uniref:TetR family transcriptional regulator n=1 Tax=Actinomadura verrucosospora TaxID=46165 RepID=A0A7D3ZT96_ACTVE|nr:TetR/AcrR family transcriptional regulator [Actinomadura verrucosospora]QKG27243.1 TetR family transcriptional regulator [Actinomadura verrucosospora]
MPNTEDSELPPGLALAWGLPVKTTKLGRKPSQSIEQIVGAAVELADADGFGALSMPKIAQRLGLTANAIYRYVRSRDELLVLVAEAAWGTAPDLASVTGDWRDAANAWTRAMIDRCDVHPWLCDLPVRGAPVTPNLLDWTEAILKVLTGAGLTPTEALRCAFVLDGYARQIGGMRRDLRYSTAPPAQSDTVTRFLLPRLHERGHSVLASMMDGNDYTDDVVDDDVTFGLDRILDGIGALVTAKRATEPASQGRRGARE